MTQAQTHRSEAIHMMMALYLGPGLDGDFNASGHAPGTMGENIAKLASLGRTARWQAAIDRWTRMANETGDSDWALIQGAIFAQHALT